MPIAYSAERSVLLKILLHSAGHPSQSVNGVLLGKLKPKPASEAPQDGQGTPRAAQQQVAVEVVDALPFLHTFLTLAPMTEVALVQVRLALQQTPELLLQSAFQTAADAVCHVHCRLKRTPTQGACSWWDTTMQMSGYRTWTWGLPAGKSQTGYTLTRRRHVRCW